MKFLKLLTLLGALGLTACDEGPAERIGEDIDNAATDIGNAVEDACEDVSNSNC